jgi:hypothetical protein
MVRCTKVGLVAAAVFLAAVGAAPPAEGGPKWLTDYAAAREAARAAGKPIFLVFRCER